MAVYGYGKTTDNHCAAENLNRVAFGLRDELLTVISTGDDTIGIANTVTLFNIYNNREIHDRLLEELRTVMPTPDAHVPYTQLEKLPYLNETLFEEPRKFDPERWLQGPEVTAERAKFLVPFSRGSRSCLGINLAYMEMYMAIAYIVRRFELDLVGTSAEDMQWDDMVVPQFHGEFLALTKRRVD
ncbi:uncharacterized protein N7498_002773 [Penicillium cinerascens]|uniref:Uncharacterized protein n=1 Tax=Penicillium cinerascens TaxID=70096 RepID=A0A9W9TBE8_9EURO|nr:uncharacterized protein N7498_002773 [Penicillium cinerascens]KAJ5216366.1 hypothetical protein N7498_002773 [Penicillium cinerascens]